MTAEPPTTRIGPGPLVVPSRNPRYFAHRDDDTGRAVYLTGSHIWNNLQDGMGPGPDAPDEPERLDFDAYLRFLTERGHNLIRLWRWEQFRSQAAGGSYHLDMSPQPWARSGPGTAKDGRPRFDLERFDEAFFARLRQRVEQAGEAGIYVDVLLFDGWALHLSPAPDHIEGHPFHALNNVNGVSATSIDDVQVLPLDAAGRGDPAGVRLQGRRHPARPAERAVGGVQRVHRRRRGEPGVRRLPGDGRASVVG